MYGFALSNVHIFCFAASYTVALILEVSRLFLRAPVRVIGTVGFTAAGLLAQAAYIVMRSTPRPQQPPPLSSWYDWLLLIAWGVAAAYLLIKLRRPQAATGIFMLPVVLGLIGIAHVFEDVPPFPRSQALYAWIIVHGVALLLGSVVVMLGFVAGVMYLVQSHRLKRKLPPRQGLRLPSLEWLQNANKRALLVSSWLLAVGLLAGVAMNIVKGREGMAWTDPVVWTSGILFIWLIVVLTFESLYRPARQGRKVAYLTLASFVFLGLVLGIVLLGPSQHASPQDDGNAAEEDAISSGVTAMHSSGYELICRSPKHSPGRLRGGGVR
jgi:ABC-type transport system involved in cytochrome c biogenesis permease subunit